jgi:uncharacterized protein (TIRG00374 family)
MILYVRRYWRTISISILLILLIYFIASNYLDWDGVFESVKKIGIVGFIFVLIFSLVNYFFRFIRWRRYTSKLGYSIPTVVNLFIYLSGFSLAITPGKSGELIRSWLLKNENVRYVSSIAILVSERVSDLVSLLILLLMTSVYGVFYSKVWLVVMIICSIVFLLVFLFGQTNIIRIIYQWIYDKDWKSTLKFVDFFLRMSVEFRKCNRVKILFTSVTFGVVAWAAEGVGFFLIVYLVSDIGPSLSQSIFVYVLATLIGGITFLPGGLGTTEAVMLTLLINFGVGHEESVAITILARLATLWFGVTIGISAVIIGKKYLKNTFTLNKSM